MRMQNKKLVSYQRLANNGPLVVLGNGKTRDAPVIYHRRDDPLLESGPPVGTGPPGGVGPPRIQGNRLEMILRKNEINGITLALKWFNAGEERKNINLNKRKTKMKNFKLKRLLSLALLGCMSAWHAPTVFAAASDTISNTATLTFDVGGTPTVIESAPTGNSTTGPGNGTSTDFVEDRLINFTVAEVGLATTSAGVVPNATLRVQEFTVTNLGNAPQDFLLAALNQATGTLDPFGGANDAFDVTASVFVDNGVAGYIQADDTDIFIDELAAGASRTVYIVSTIPGTATNGQVAVTTLVAQVAVGGTASADDSVAANAGAAIMNDNNGHASPVGTYNNGVTTTVATTALALAAADVVDDPTVVETVFNDPAGATATDEDSTGAAQDVVQNGQHSDSDSYTVGAAILTVTKTAATLWDPANGSSNPKAIPGAYVRYTITVANDAAAGASGFLTTMGDTLSAAGVGIGAAALDPDFIDGTAAALAAPGAPTSAAEASFQIDTNGTTRTVPGLSYCTAAPAVPDADGCTGSLAAGGAISIDYSTVAAMAIEDIAPLGSDAGEDYVAGELKPGESVVIRFNAIIQ